MEIHFHPGGHAEQKEKKRGVDQNDADRLLIFGRNLHRWRLLTTNEHEYTLIKFTFATPDRPPACSHRPVAGHRRPNSRARIGTAHRAVATTTLFPDVPGPVLLHGECRC